MAIERWRLKVILRVCSLSCEKQPQLHLVTKQAKSHNGRLKQQSNHSIVELRKSTDYVLEYVFMYVCACYLCRVRLSWPVQALILFWASKWFMPSVEMPLMDRMMSPTLILALAALPPSVSCKETHTHNNNTFIKEACNECICTKQIRVIKIALWKE